MISTDLAVTLREAEIIVRQRQSKLGVNVEGMSELIVIQRDG